MSTGKLTKSQRCAAICVVLALGTFALYLPVRSNGFINFDDNGYITENDHVKAGLTWPGIVWAFQSGYAANWHPLTWISHMMDCQLFGLHPGAHHLMNVLFHTANTVLLFILLNYLTGAMWRSAFVAALFAWHPLHVESVAWASERKDVLSGFFWMLTLIAYARYVRAQSSANFSMYRHGIFDRTILPHPRPLPPGEGELSTDVLKRRATLSSAVINYCLALLLFACALMSKPMVVTLPFVLLLLDFWPLQRWGFFMNRPPHPNPPSQGGKGELSGAAQTKHSTLPQLLIEKIPFFALTLAGSVVTYLVQKNAGAVAGSSLSFRIGNALASYVDYISKLFWPVDLAIFYPFPAHGMVFMAIVGLVLLGVCSVAFIFLAKRWPYLFTGWFWFLGALVPAIGIVEVGSAFMADRYSYLPSIGLFIVVTWGAADFFESRQEKAVPTVAAIAILTGCVILTSFQVRYWRNNFTLFNHALAVTPDNYVADACLGHALDGLGREKEALAYCNEAVKIDPDYPAGQFFLGQVLWKLNDADEALPHLNAAAQAAPNNSNFQYNLGKFLVEHGQTEAGISRFNAALADDPDFAEAFNALGKAFLKQDKLPQAAARLAQATDLQPRNAQFHYDLGTVFLTMSETARAIDQFSQAVQLKPDFAQAHDNLAAALAGQGQLDEAITHFAIVTQLQPEDPDAWFNLGFAYLNDHQPTQAAAQFLRELRLTPNATKAHYRLAEALAGQNQPTQAVAEYRQTLRLTPNFPQAQKELDEILAAYPQLR